MDGRGREVGRKMEGWQHVGGRAYKEEQGQGMRATQLNCYLHRPASLWPFAENAVSYGSDLVRSVPALP
jgi:hypothetical protein